ncbi:MAG: hypothetical protein KatS3mg009_1688 [Acidimicrobiia bacterium]|nr:MAG: hypothetical protein KatS3mg009_1688 [Acidimicrobiia bacterium]
MRAAGGPPGPRRPPRYTGRFPVAAFVVPWSRYAAIVRSAVRIRWISSAPSAKRAQRACR